MFLYWHFRALLAVALAVVAFLYFAIAAPGFVSSLNIYALLQSFAGVGLLAVGLAVVMIAGEFDLSLSGVVPLAGVVAIKFGQSVNVFVGIALAIAVCVVFGLINGFVTARFRIPSLAVTVGTLVLSLGLGFYLADDNVVTMTNYHWGLALDAPILALFSIHSIIAFVLIVAIGFALTRTRAGKGVYAIGSDLSRAQTSGVKVVRTLVVSFVLLGALEGIVGSLQGVALASGTPGADNNSLLQSVTAAIIGGVALAGGRGKIYGVVAGAMLLAIIGNGLSFIGAPDAVVQLGNGVLLIIVVLADRPLDRLVRRRLLSAIAVPLDAPSGLQPETGDAGPRQSVTAKEDAQ